MNMLARIAATAVAAAIAVPASAVITTYNVSLTPPITFSSVTGSQSTPYPASYTPVTGRTIVIPRLALATRQTITKVTIDLLTTLKNDNSVNSSVRNGTGSAKTYTVVNNSATTLSGPLPSGSALSLTNINTISTGTLSIPRQTTQILTWTSPQVTNSLILTTGYLNGFVSGPGRAGVTLRVGGTGSVNLTANGNLDLFIKSLVDTSVRVSYESRDWVPGDPPVPEPATWMTMIAGFGLVGGMMRRRRVAGIAAR